MPREWVLARFIGPGVGVLNSFFARGVGNSPIKKIARGGWSGLELTDTSHFTPFQHISEPYPKQVSKATNPTDIKQTKMFR